MDQYPDSIVITVNPDPSESSGVYTAATGTSSVYTFSCRAEVNGSGKKIISHDGSQIDYLFDVYLPVTTSVIPHGSDFVLTCLNNGVIKGSVKRASNGQLNSRLWL